MQNRKYNIIMASNLPGESIELIKETESKDLPYRIFTPSTLNELDEISGRETISLIITDLSFQNGSLIDWVELWPYPFILLIDDADTARLDSILIDEASTFLLRREDMSHIKFLPSTIKKMLNTRESLDRQNSFLKLSERQYLNLVQALPDIIYVLDADGRFTFINNAIRILGWEPVELIGKHFSEILFSDDLPKVSRDRLLPALRGRITGPDRAPKLFDERRTGTRMTRGLNIKLKRKATIGGKIKGALIAYGEITSVGYLDSSNRFVTETGTAGIIRDSSVISASRNPGHDSDLVIEGESALGHEEVHHLINNKLQALSSLISLKQSFCEDSEVASALNETQIQIYTLSLIYQNMVTINGKNRIKMQTYLADVIKHITSSFSADPWAQEIELHCEAIYLLSDAAIALAMLLTEVLTVIFRLQEQHNQINSPITITFLINNGIAQLKTRIPFGISEEYVHKLKDDSSGVIISALADQLHGEFYTDEHTFTLFFNIDKNQEGEEP